MARCGRLLTLGENPDYCEHCVGYVKTCSGEGSESLLLAD